MIVILFPMFWISSVASAFHDPLVSIATGMKMWVLVMPVYFAFLAMAALSHYYYYHYYYYENLLHAQCQCFMIESEAWNVSLKLFKRHGKKLVSRFRRNESKEGEVVMSFGRFFQNSEAAALKALALVAVLTRGTVLRL